MALWTDLIGLFFPRLCCACRDVLLRNESTICTRCLSTLPKTDFHQHEDNPVASIFWGRIPIQHATAFLYFTKAGRVQHMLHQFKYRGDLEVGRLLGKLFGQQLKDNEKFKEVEAIIPIPLHPTKLKQRGFNQSEIFGNEMASQMRIPILTDVLTREKMTQTQTRKSRFERWLNVSYGFRVHHPEKISGKHILLIDDVVTTGATIESAASALLEVPGLKISVAFLAISVQ